MVTKTNVTVYDEKGGLRVISSEEFARSETRFLAAVVEIAPGLERDIVTGVIVHGSQLYVPIQDYVTKRRRAPYVLAIRTADCSLVGFSHRGHLWSKGVRVEGVDLARTELKLSDGGTASLNNVARDVGLVLDPISFPYGWTLAWLLEVVPDTAGALAKAYERCPKCEGDGERAIFYPPHVGFCRKCDIVWRRPEPVKWPELDNVRVMLMHQKQVKEV